jgi:hypothetical protein
MKLALLTISVLLMLGGAALLLADAVSAAIAIPLIAIGIAVTVIVQMRAGRQHSHPAH